MILAQVLVELRHGEPLKLFLPYEELYRSLTGEEIPEKEMPLPGFQLNVPQKTMRVVVDPKRTAVILGNVPSTSYCIDNIMAVFRKVSDLIQLPNVKRLGIRSSWFEASELGFDELVTIFELKI